MSVHAYPINSLLTLIDANLQGCLRIQLCIHTFAWTLWNLTLYGTKFSFLIFLRFPPPVKWTVCILHSPSSPPLPPKGCHIPCKIREIPNTTHKQKSSIYHAKGAGGRLALRRIWASTEFNILKWVKGSEFVFLRVEMSRSRRPRSLSSTATSHASRRPRWPVMIKAGHVQSLLIQGSFSTPHHKSRQRWWRLRRVMRYLPVLGRRTLAVALMVFFILQRSANTSARKFYHC